MNIEILKELGLREKEIKVYVTGLKIGMGTVSLYADKAELSRTTTHDVLKSLKEKGLANYVVKSGVRYFSVVNPQELLERLKEKEHKLKTLLPELKALQEVNIKQPQVEFYQGIEGFKTVAHDLIKKPNSTIYCFLAVKNLEYLPIFHLQFRRRRKEGKIKVKMITERTKIAKELKVKDKKELRKTRFLDGIMKNSNTSLFIYGDKIAHIMATEKEQLGVITQNKDIAEFNRRMFDQMWKQAKP